MNSDIVSIHSQDENNFIMNIIPERDSSLFLGMHQKLKETATDSTLYCTWSNNDECDFGYYKSETDPARQKPPWLPKPVRDTSESS
jgi:hypothetical protein